MSIEQYLEHLEGGGFLGVPDAAILTAIFPEIGITIHDSQGAEVAVLPGPNMLHVQHNGVDHFTQWPPHASPGPGPMPTGLRDQRYVLSTPAVAYLRREPAHPLPEPSAQIDAWKAQSDTLLPSLLASAATLPRPVSLTMEAFRILDIGGLLRSIRLALFPGVQAFENLCVDGVSLETYLDRELGLSVEGYVSRMSFPNPFADSAECNLALATATAAILAHNFRIGITILDWKGSELLCIRPNPGVEMLYVEFDGCNVFTPATGWGGTSRRRLQGGEAASFTSSAVIAALMLAYTEKYSTKK